MNNYKKNNVYNNVFKKNLCLRCGACVSICSVKALNMQFNKKIGFYVLEISDDCCQCGKCLKICPALDSYDSNTLIGKYINIYLTCSSNFQIQKDSTSGGSINSFCRYLLDEHVVDYIISVKNNINSIVKTEVTLINDSSEFYNNPRSFSSRYILVPTCSKLSNLNKNLKYAFIGTPCQIRSAKKILGEVGIYLGIACSQGISYKATERYFSSLNLKSIDNIYYRGNGWPGYTTIESNKKIFSQMHLHSNFNAIFSSQVYKNIGCRQCHEQFAEEADISFFDFWNQKEIQTEHIGKSGTIIRTTNGKKLFENALKKNYLEINLKLSEEDVINSQFWVILMKKKYFNHIYIRIFYKIVDIIRYLSFDKSLPIFIYFFLGKIFRKLIYIIHDKN